MNDSENMTPTPEISVVLPGYNEAENIAALLEQNTAVLNSMSRPYEIIFVDDGSTDSSREVLEAAKSSCPVLRVISHRSNFGQSAAILTGIEAARGDVVITMDSDLQNDPADIPAMFERMNRENADAICGVRQKRQDNRVKLISSRIANGVRHLALNDHISDAGCSLRIMRRRALRQLPAFKALHRFLPTIMMIHGYKVIEMPISHRARGAGISKYGVGNRLWVGVMDIFGLRWYRRRFLPADRTLE